MVEHDSVIARTSGDASSHRSPDTGRAQVNFDFAIGASIFIFALLFAFSIAPGLFTSPAVDNQESNDLRAERAAGWLTEEGRADTTYCLAKLLDKSTPDIDCGFSGSALDEQLPIDGSVNVSLMRNASGNSSAKLYWNGVDYEIVTSSTSGSYLSRGPDYASAENVGFARRTVRVGRNETTITVRAW